MCHCYCVCTYKYLKENTKRAQAKPVYCGKKKRKRKKREANEPHKLSNNCENIVRIYLVDIIVYAHINNKYLKEMTKKHKQNRRKKKKTYEQYGLNKLNALYKITVCAFTLFIYRRNLFIYFERGNWPLENVN